MNPYREPLPPTKDERIPDFRPSWRSDPRVIWRGFLLIVLVIAWAGFDADSSWRWGPPSPLGTVADLVVASLALALFGLSYRIRRARQAQEARERYDDTRPPPGWSESRDDSRAPQAWSASRDSTTQR